MATVDTPKPFPIFSLAGRYILYDVDIVSYVRREHHICGVLIGGLPQASQQNVFMGLPLQLMPEEVRLLVDAGVAYLVDDVQAHKHAFLSGGMTIGERRAYQAALWKQGLGAAKEASKRADQRKKTALKQKFGEGDWNDIPEDMLVPTNAKRKNKAGRRQDRVASTTTTEDQVSEDETLFSSNGTGLTAKTHTPPASTTSTAAPEPAPWAVTPTTSYPPLTSSEQSTTLPAVPKSYPLFKLLHQQGYFLSPGLRFGCQYMAYPGDPLRFHSHFLCQGMDWDEEFDLLDLVGGGRLGTGVKKGYLIGGQEQQAGSANKQLRSTHTEVAESDVRAFCIEWGGM